MATDEEIQRLILQVDGVERVKELNGVLDQERDALRGLLQDLHAGRLTLDQFGNAAGPVAEKMVDLEKKIKDLQGSPGLNGRGILGASYAFQDFVTVLSGGGGLERALFAVSNNIDQLATAAGASTAAAAKLSIAFTGFTAALPVLIPLFKELWAAVSGGEMAEEAEAKLKRLKSEFEALIGTPTKSEKAGLDALKEAVTEGDADRVFKGLAEGVTTDAGLRSDFTAGERKEMADLRDQMRLNPGVRFLAGERRIAEIEAARSGRDLERARGLMTTMLKPGEAGENALRTVRGIVDHNPSAFPAGFLGDVEMAFPENRKAQEEIDRQGRANSAAAAREEHRREQEMKDLDAENAHIDDVDAANRADFRRGRAARQRKERADEHQAALENADAERADAAWIRGRQARRVRALRPAIVAASQSGGFGTPTDHQSDEMAQSVIAMTRQGVDTNTAIMSAVMTKAQQIAQLEQRLAVQQMQAQRLMMGGDQSGQFSMMPAGPF